MTRYTVIWHGFALGQLANLHMYAADPQGVTRASHAIDIELETDAAMKGAHWKGGLRILKMPPLSALFMVREQDRTVWVLTVKLNVVLPPASTTNGQPSPPTS